MTEPTERAVDAPDVPAGPERGCSMPDCAGRHRARGYCAAHYLRWSRHGDPTGGGRARARRATTYGRAHQRVRDERGPASGLPCAGCDGPAGVWSYDGTDPDEQVEPGRGRVYSLDPARYRPYCRSCHRLVTLRGPGAGALDVARAARLYRAGATTRGIAALLNASRSTVLAALRAHGVLIRPPGPPRRTDRGTTSTSRTQAIPSVSEPDPISARQRRPIRIP